MMLALSRWMRDACMAPLCCDWLFPYCTEIADYRFPPLVMRLRQASASHTTAEETPMENMP